jgi:hypothetical protein
MITLSLICGQDQTGNTVTDKLHNEECVKTNFEVLIFQTPEEADKPWMDYWYALALFFSYYFSYTE